MADYQAQCSSNRYITLLLRTQVVSQDVAGNTSTINWSLHVLKSSASTSATWGNCSYSVTINGNAYSGSGQVRVEAGGDTTVLSGTTVIPHNADGTKSFNLRASISGYIVGSLSDSESLATIPRASTIACGTFTMGSSGAITITRASSGFTHTILWAFGTASGTVVTKTAGTSVPWTPPTATMAPQIPNATAGTGTLTCITYSGNTEIGRTSIGFTAYLPASVVPSISGVTTTEGTAGLADKFGAFVQYKSTLKVSVSAAGIYGSTIKSCTVNVDSKTYSGTSIITSAITGSGALTMTVTVNDSRGRTASKSILVDVSQYDNPAITQLNAYRCNSDGDYDDAGDYASITYVYSVSPVNSKNYASAKIEYKRSTDTDWIELISSSAYSGSDTIVSSQELLSDYQYYIRLTVSDFFGSTSMVTAIPSASVIYDILSSGNGIGVGKTAEIPNLFDSAWPIRVVNASEEGPYIRLETPNGSFATIGTFVGNYGDIQRLELTCGNTRIDLNWNGSVSVTGSLNLNGAQMQDFVVAQGTSGSWKFSKWANGLAICFTTTSYCNSNWATQTWGSDTCTDDITFPDYPFPFVEEPVCYASLAKPDAASQYGYFFWPAHNSNGSVSRPPAWCLVRPDGAPGTYAVGHPRIKMVAIGRWK